MRLPWRGCPHPRRGLDPRPRSIFWPRSASTPARSTPTVFGLEDLPAALHYARERIDDAIKVVVKTRGKVGSRIAADAE
jgi:hypothetical protein